MSGRIIVPFIAGSAPDVAARQVAQRLTASLGQQSVIENKPGVSPAHHHERGPAR